DLFNLIRTDPGKLWALINSLKSLVQLRSRLRRRRVPGHRGDIYGTGLPDGTPGSVRVDGRTQQLDQSHTYTHSERELGGAVGGPGGDELFGVGLLSGARPGEISPVSYECSIPADVTLARHSRHTVTAMRTIQSSHLPANEPHRFVFASDPAARRHVV